MRLDDEALRAQLERRAGGGSSAPERLMPAIAARVAETPPIRRWRLTLEGWAPRLGLSGAAVAAALVVVLAAQPSIPHRSAATPTGGAVAGYPGDRALTAEELAGLVHGSRLGREQHVVADVEIIRTDGLPCPDERRRSGCPSGYLAGIEPRIPVYESIALVIEEDLAPPFLFEYRPEWPDSLFTVGLVRTPDDGLTWSLPDVLAHIETLPPGPRPPAETFLVDAWLVQTDAVYRCTAPVPGADPAFACGPAAWLSPARGAALEPPPGSLRVQNGARAVFTPRATAGTADRAVFAIRREEPADCFECPPAGAATITARIDRVGLGPTRGPSMPPATLSAEDLELEAAPPDSAFDRPTTEAIVASARKGAIFLEPAVFTPDLVAAQVTRGPTHRTANVVFHDYDGGGLVVAEMRQRSDGWVSTDVRHDAGGVTLSAWELERARGIVEDGGDGVPLGVRFVSAEPAPCPPGRSGSFCVSAHAAVPDLIVDDGVTYQILIDLRSAQVLQTAFSR